MSSQRWIKRRGASVSVAERRRVSRSVDDYPDADPEKKKGYPDLEKLTWGRTGVPRGNGVPVGVLEFAAGVV